VEPEVVTLGVAVHACTRAVDDFTGADASLRLRGKVVDDLEWDISKQKPKSDSKELGGPVVT
jgi:hypothetical protein